MGSRREQYQFQYGTYAGPAQLKKSYFPFFKDGDVKIIISGSRQYQLHSGILKISSNRLASLLNDEYTAKLSKQAIKKGVVIRNKLVAEANVNPTPDVDVVLTPIKLDSEGNPVCGHTTSLDLENGIEVPPVYVAYDLVLGAFYNRPLELGEFGKSSLRDILEMALEVLQVAEYLEVVDLITKPFEAALLSRGQLLHRSIAQDPSVWLDFSYRIKSRVIFREALIHASGQYNRPSMQTAIRETMRPDVATVVHKRGGLLKEGVKKAMRKVLSHYPKAMQRALTVGIVDIDSIGRHSYGNDIMMWMALTAFRHYVSQHVANDQTHHADDMGFSLITAISQGGDKYLDKLALADFHRVFPMSGRGMTVLESKLTEIKEAVKQFVKPLVKNNSQLDTNRADNKYFTCQNVEADDYPWTWEDKPEQTPELIDWDTEDEGDYQEGEYILADRMEDGDADGDANAESSEVQSDGDESFDRP